MSARDVYRMVDELIGSHVREHGFQRHQDGEYLRMAADGMDRILFDCDDRKSKVSVLVGYYPADLAFMEDFLRGEDRGFPVAPYLSPHARREVARRHRSDNPAGGALALARQFYEALFDRFRTMFEQFGEALVMREAGQQFIYVAEKLGRDQAIASRFREKLGYARVVPPLRS